MTPGTPASGVDALGEESAEPGPGDAATLGIAAETLAEVATGAALAVELACLVEHAVASSTTPSRASMGRWVVLMLGRSFRVVVLAVVRRWATRVPFH